ncbi:arginase family protein [Bacteriovoracaceae bacterium]|nr:arginase family protein [Bacteriovoracaceae bacterium]
MYLDRDQESLNSILLNLDEMNQLPSQVAAHLFLSPNDYGVVRNYGRPGARFAPQSVLQQLKILNKIDSNPITYQSACDFNYNFLKNNDEYFNSIQNEEFLIMKEGLKKINSSHFIQIGGGHDHIYPFLKAIQSTFDLSKTPLIILNLDAHLDTRQDSSFHSGTPFRQFDHELQSNESVSLVQFGIHLANNSISTRKELTNIHQEILYFNENRNLSPEKLISLAFETRKESSNNCLFLLSVDCDAFGPEYFSGVSAVNGNGLDTDYFFQLIQVIKATKFHKRFTGFYEYNPLMDDLSSKGARFLAQSIFTLGF